MLFCETLEPRLQFDGGDVDATFGDNGTAVIDFQPALGALWQIWNEHRLTRDDGGRMYATAVAFQGEHGPTQTLIARLSRDGRVDPKFAAGGFHVLDRDPANFDKGDTTVSVDPRNRAYVSDGPLLWRLTPSGKIDRTFGRRGKIVVPTRLGLFNQGVGFDIDGRPLVSGMSGALGGAGQVSTVFRLTENGTIDTSWAENGVFRGPIDGPPPTTIPLIGNGSSLADDQILVSGTYHPDANDVALWVTRLNREGSIDRSYGDNGYATASFASSEFLATTASLVSTLPDGSVIGFVSAVIEATEANESREFNFKISADGRAVSTIALVPSPGFVDAQILAQPDGKLIALNDVATIIRVNADGTPDATWSTAGLTPPPNSFFEPSHLSPDGSLVIAASSDFDDGSRVYIKRLFRDDAPVPEFHNRTITAPRTTALRLSVTWRDYDAIDPVTFDSLDLRVRGPFDGATRWRGVTLESVMPLGDGRFRATYKLTSPDGWTAADNGEYRVRLMSGQVQDEDGNLAPAGTLGTFRINIS